MSNFDYATAPMSGYFLVQYTRPGDPIGYEQGVQADSPDDLAVKVDAYAAEHGLVVEGATFAGRPVPGIGGDR